EEVDGTDGTNGTNGTDRTDDAGIRGNGVLSKAPLLAFVGILLALCGCDLAAKPSTANSKLGALNSELAPLPRATNASWRDDGELRFFSADVAGLTTGHTYEVQSSQDGSEWRRRLSILWTNTDPDACWSTEFPMLPPSPPGLDVREMFRVEDVTT